MYTHNIELSFKLLGSLYQKKDFNIIDELVTIKKEICSMVEWAEPEKTEQLAAIEEMFKFFVQSSPPEKLLGKQKLAYLLYFIWQAAADTEQLVNPAQALSNRKKLVTNLLLAYQEQQQEGHSYNTYVSALFGTLQGQHPGIFFMGEEDFVQLNNQIELLKNVYGRNIYNLQKKIPLIRASRASDLEKYQDIHNEISRFKMLQAEAQPSCWTCAWDLLASLTTTNQPVVGLIPKPPSSPRLKGIQK